MGLGSSQRVLRQVQRLQRHGQLGIENGLQQHVDLAELEAAILQGEVDELYLGAEEVAEGDDVLLGGEVQVLELDLDELLAGGF